MKNDTTGKHMRATVFCAILLAAGCTTAPPDPATRAVVIQELTGPFDNPEGAIVALDNASVFISNAGCISGEFAFPVGAGYITKMKMGDDGRLSLVKKDFVPGLTRPWGMAVLPLAVGSVPAGTIFVGVGGPPLVGVDHVSELASGIVAFDPESGTRRGMIATGQGSPFEKKTGGPVLAINALAFDRNGDLYFTDSGLGADCFPKSGTVPIRQGVWKVDAGRLADLMAGKADPDDVEGLSFCYACGCPDGVEVSREGTVYINTVGGAAAGLFGSPLYDPFGGAVFAVTDEDFEAGHVTRPPLARGLGALDGLDFTPGGEIVCTEIMDKGDLVLIDPKTGSARFLGIPDLKGPGDHAVVRKGDRVFVIIPEHTSGIDDTALPRAARKELTVIELVP